jgi:hypothetical protein
LKQKGKPKMNAKAETTAAENETVDVAIVETKLFSTIARRERTSPF